MTELPRFLLGPVRSALRVQTSAAQSGQGGEAMACTHHWALQPSSYISLLTPSEPKESQSPHLTQGRPEKTEGGAVRMPQSSQLDKTGEF